MTLSYNITDFELNSDGDCVEYDNTESWQDAKDYDNLGYRLSKLHGLSHVTRVNKYTYTGIRYDRQLDTNKLHVILVKENV